MKDSSSDNDPILTGTSVIQCCNLSIVAFMFFPLFFVIFAVLVLQAPEG